MTTKTIKSILLATIMLSIVVPVTGFSLAEAKIADALPEDKLLQRDNSWKAQYSNEKEFEKDQRAINGYVDAEHPDNKWNKQTKKNQIVIYNFDTLTDVKGAGLSALLADVEMQKASGKYNPTQAEEKFHNWAAQNTETVEFEAPQGQIKKVINAWNSNANYGNVSNEVKNTDLDFWTNVSVDKVCELLDDCNTSGEQPTIECGLLPCADATWYSAYHLLTGFLDTSQCETGSCDYSDSDSGIGSLSILMDPGTNNHAKSVTIDYTVVDKSYFANYDVWHHFDGTAQIGWEDEDFDEYGWNEIEVDDSLTVGSCGSSHCGTYSLSASADGAYFEA